MVKVDGKIVEIHWRYPNECHVVIEIPQQVGTRFALGQSVEVRREYDPAWDGD